MATGDVSKVDGLEEGQIDETNEVQDAQEDSDPGPVIEKWQPMIDAIVEATKEAFPASPAFDASSPSTFQTYWRGIFTSLKDSILKNQEMPQYLTEPPLPTFNATLFDNRHVLGCPCCQSDSEPAIELEKDKGVTKEDLMDAIIDAMYGEALPKVFVELAPMRDDDDDDDDDDDEETADAEIESEDGSEDDIADTAVFTNDSGVLIYAYSWMSSGNNDEGERIMYGDEPDVVLYCCRPDEFEKKTKSREKDLEHEGDSKGARESKL
ncbi:hypothetical protein N0V84_007827 [Fusarium piperis]|uniref:Uncharacterized protein n=1 Tax=Fusarium piperis TaxID=1435070 RepID=A0A9W8W9B0_9HYPO|nr:hypothetical protein N0V84_007827 [Fusarium piperis]